MIAYDGKKICSQDHKTNRGLACYCIHRRCQITEQRYADDLLAQDIRIRYRIRIILLVGIALGHDFSFSQAVLDDSVRSRRVPGILADEQDDVSLRQSGRICLRCVNHASFRDRRFHIAAVHSIAVDPCVMRNEKSEACCDRREQYDRSDKTYEATEHFLPAELRPSVTHGASFLSGAGLLFFRLIEDAHFGIGGIRLASCRSALSADLYISAFFRACRLCVFFTVCKTDICRIF